MLQNVLIVFDARPKLVCQLSIEKSNLLAYSSGGAETGSEQQDVTLFAIFMATGQGQGQGTKRRPGRSTL